jgi:biopolymer transport protein ExbB/TolQ
VAGTAAVGAPGWLDPAVESALLLGLLGTIHGMVSGFIGVSPEQLQPGPLVHSLGAALRSSLVGFGIALVGVWTNARRPTESADAQRAEGERRPEPERERRASARSGRT